MKKLTEKEINYINDKSNTAYSIHSYYFILNLSFVEKNLDSYGGIEKLKHSPFYISTPIKTSSSLRGHSCDKIFIDEYAKEN